MIAQLPPAPSLMAPFAEIVGKLLRRALTALIGTQKRSIDFPLQTHDYPISYLMGLPPYFFRVIQRKTNIGHNQYSVATRRKISTHIRHITAVCSSRFLRGFERGSSTE